MINYSIHNFSGILKPMSGDLKGLVEGEDYYFNDRRRLVFTESYLEKKGKCCYSGCLHCPYDKKLKNRKINPDIPQELQLDSSQDQGPSDEDLQRLAQYYADYMNK